MELIIYIERNVVEFNIIFNWIMFYRRDLIVYVLYGFLIRRCLDIKIKLFLNRIKFVFVVFSWCDDFGKCYRIVREL